MDDAEKSEPRTANRPFRLKIITDPITGLLVLDAGPDAPILTSKEVHDLLIDFP